MAGARSLLAESDTVLYFAPTQDARLAVMRQANAQAAALVDQARADEDEGRRFRVVIGIDAEDITIKQRGFLHAAVFPQIAEQVKFADGSRYTAEVWKEFYRKLFLGDRFVLKRIPRFDSSTGRMVHPKRATPHRERVSTEHLTIKQYAEHIDKVIAHATTELGVVFVFDADEREAVRHKPKRRAGASKGPQQ